MEISKIFTEPRNYLIIGKKGSAKTTLGLVFLKQINELSNRKMFIYRHPNPDILKKLPFKIENITSMKQLYNLTDSCCLIDEAHRHFDVLNKSVNNDLKEILANSRQNNSSFIFITHNSYFITRGLFTYIDVRIIKEVNEGHWDTERPHMKTLYQDSNITGNDYFFIDCDEIRNKEKFDRPDWFTDEFSTAYRTADQCEKKDFFKKVLDIARRCG